MELYNIYKMTRCVNRFYKDFKYPEEFVKLIKLKLVNFDNWYFFPLSRIEIRMKGLQQRYTKRDLIPFAMRDNCDDIACFELGKGNKVQIIHDFVHYGSEQIKEYNNFWDWFRDAIEEIIDEFENERKQTYF